MIFIENDEQVTDKVEVTFLRDKKDEDAKMWVDHLRRGIDAIPGGEFLVTLFGIDKQREDYTIYIVDGAILRSNIALVSWHEYINCIEMGRRPFGTRLEDIQKVTFVYNGPLLVMSEMVIHYALEGKKTSIGLPLMHQTQINACKELCDRNGITYGQRIGARLILMVPIIALAALGLWAIVS